MKALIIAEAQNDFSPGCVLPILEGDVTVSLINRLQQQFEPARQVNSFGQIRANLISVSRINI